MTRDRDIAAFDARAGSYEGGWLGRLHRQIADRTVDLALAVAPRPQRAGLAECARVLAPGGSLVLTDLFSGWLTPTLVGGRRHKARTKRRASRLLAGAGFHGVRWHEVEAVVIRAVTAARG